MTTDQGTVRFVVDGLTAQVFSPFEAKDIIKTVPKCWRRWDGVDKCWIVDALGLRDLRRALELEGFTVVTRTRGGSDSTTDRPKRGGDSWADLMYRDLGRPLADRVYKALLPVLHPDRGGDNEAMKALNVARDRAAVSK